MMRRDATQERGGYTIEGQDQKEARANQRLRFNDEKVEG